jgi:hypothetical protein
MGNIAADSSTALHFVQITSLQLNTSFVRLAIIHLLWLHTVECESMINDFGNLWQEMTATYFKILCEKSRGILVSVLTGSTG